MSSATRSTQERPIQLTWSEKDKQVIICPEDQDRFVMSAGEVIAACRGYDRSGRRLPRPVAREHGKGPSGGDIQKHANDILRLLNVLGSWVHERQKLIDRAFVTLRDRGLLFLVIMKGRKYDRDLESQLTTLDLDIARTRQFKTLQLGVLALPACDEEDYASFLNPDFAARYCWEHGK